MMKKQQIAGYKINSNSGFTLIEILVVFSVVAILAGIGIASFVSYSRSQELNQLANNIKLIVNEAKFNSLSVVKTVTNDSGQSISCGAQSLLGYRIDILASSITLTQVCDEIAPPNRTIKTINLSQTLSISPGTSCSQIFFNTLSSNLSGVPCSVEIEGFGQTKTIAVDAIGNVNVN